MGAVHFSLDVAWVDTLRQVFPLDVFVETGTFRGDTVDSVLHEFAEIQSVEWSAQLFAEARARFQDHLNVHLGNDNSPAWLRGLAPNLTHRSVLYWLDAHWCSAADTAGIEAQCPLLEELEALGTLNDQSVVLIDDARLFMSPPPQLHNGAHWPRFHAVLERLQQLGNRHEITIVNDVIAFYPQAARVVVHNYCQAFGLDWLSVMETSRQQARQTETLMALISDHSTQVNTLLARTQQQAARVNELLAHTQQQAAQLEAMRRPSNPCKSLVQKIFGLKRDGVHVHVGQEPSPSKPQPAAGTQAKGDAESASNPVAGLQRVEMALSGILSSLVPTRWMLDVGAHRGSSLEPFLHAGWKVCAFEPIEANRRQLAAAFQGADDLTIRSEAVSNETGTKAFHLALNPDGSLHEYYHSLEETPVDPWHKKGSTVMVPTVRLDDLLARGELPRHVGFLKIDTEGHDLAVLQGASQLTCDVISVEFWGDDHAFGKSPSPAPAMIELLRERGYESYITICHEGDASTVLYTSLDGVRPDAWGNIVFFRQTEQDLYRQVIADRGWHFVLNVARECDGLRAQLRAKEAVIGELDATAKMFANAAAERLQLIERLHHSEPAPLKRRLVTRLAGAALKLVGVRSV